MTSFIKDNNDRTLYLWSENAKKVLLDTSIGGNVDSITLTNGGSGYTSMPTVNFSGDGANATATATGVVNNITLTNSGSYTVAPTSLSLLGGGTGATASIGTTEVATKYPRQLFTSLNDVIYTDGTVVRIFASVNLDYWRLYDNNTNSRWLTGVAYNSTTGISTQSSKYFNSDNNFYGEWAMIDLGQKILLEYYKIHLNNPINIKGRTPEKFRIYATNDDASWNNTTSGSWVQIHEVNDPAITQVGNTTFTVPNNQTAYRYYAIIVNKLIGGAGGAYLQITEWELYGYPLETKYPRNPLTNSDTCKQSSFADPFGYPTHNLFNHNNSDSFITIPYYRSGDPYVFGFKGLNGYDGEWVMININESFVLNKIILYPSTDLDGAAGKFRIYGTNNTSLFTTSEYNSHDQLFSDPNLNSTDWTLIHDQTTRLTDYAVGVGKEVFISNIQPFSIYIMIVNQLSGSSDRLSLNEWELYNKPIRTYTVNSITLTNGGSGYTTAPQVVFNGGTVTTSATTPVPAFTTTPASASSTLSLSTLAITNNGSGYSTAPTVSFSGDGGSGATATTTATQFTQGIVKCIQYDWDVPDIILNENGKVSLEGIVYKTFTPVSTGTITKIKNIGTPKYNYSSKKDDGVILDVSHWDYLKKKKTKCPAVPLTPQTINKISLSVDDNSDIKGVEPTSDFVAVLKITEEEVPQAEWSNSKAVNVRQMAIPTYNQK